MVGNKALLRAVRGERQGPDLEADVVALNDLPEDGVLGGAEVIAPRAGLAGNGGMEGVVRRHPPPLPTGFQSW